MKKLYLILIIILIFIPNIVFANSIKNIDMNIFIDKEGTAHVTEVWKTNFTSGTEGYKPYYNLGQSKIKNFEVSINNTKYTYANNWDVSSSFNAKKYRNGINYLDDGVELCFGLTKYGTNTYTLNYDITNFVLNTSDGYQMVYWTLFPHNFSPSPDRIYIKIYSDFKYSNNLDVWGYGKYGTPTYVYDGYIEMDSESTVRSGEYMTILVKFPNNTFNSRVTLDKTFDEYYQMAEEGAIHYTDNSFEFNKIVKTMKLFVFMMFIAMLLPFVIIIIVIFKSVRNKKRKTKRDLNFGKTGNKINKSVPYYRYISYPKEEISRVYWLSYNYDILKKKEDFLGALLLKWYKEKKINIIKEKNDTVIILDNDLNLAYWEKRLFSMFIEASDNDKLYPKSFEKWCKKYPNRVMDWFDYVLTVENSKLVTEKKLISSTDDKYLYDVNPILYEEAIKLAGLKRFLNDFSNIKDRSSIEVNLWEEYLMYAQIFGISKKVIKEFKMVYPDIINMEQLYDIEFIRSSSAKYINVVHNAYNNKKITDNLRTSVSRSRASSYSSGGGGFSSSGGGGGSFGSGGGGGGVR